MAHGCGCAPCGDGSMIPCAAHDPMTPTLCNACGNEWVPEFDGPECPACERLYAAAEARRDEAREAEHVVHAPNVAPDAALVR